MPVFLPKGLHGAFRQKGARAVGHGGKVPALILPVEQPGALHVVFRQPAQHALVFHIGKITLVKHKVQRPFAVFAEIHQGVHLLLVQRMQSARFAALFQHSGPLRAHQRVARYFFRRSQRHLRRTPRGQHHAHPGAFQRQERQPRARADGAAPRGQQGAVNVTNHSPNLQKAFPFRHSFARRTAGACFVHCTKKQAPCQGPAAGP